MKIKVYVAVVLFSVLSVITSCGSLYFQYEDDYKYPEWLFTQYNFCHANDVSSLNENKIVVLMAATNLNPFGWSRYAIDRIDLIVNKDIKIESLFISELSLESSFEKIVVIKNKSIKDVERMFKTLKSFFSARATYSENDKKIMTMNLVYQINNGEVITQTDEVEVWK